MPVSALPRLTISEKVVNVFVSDGLQLRHCRLSRFSSRFPPIRIFLLHLHPLPSCGFTYLLMADDCTCPPLRLKPFDLTHLRYHHNDALGSVMALASLIPVFIPFGAFPAHLLATRSVRTFLFWLGLVLDHALNSVIKHRIGIPRPPQHCSALEVIIGRQCVLFGRDLCILFTR